MRDKPTPETARAALAEQGLRVSHARMAKAERELDEAVELLRGMWAIEKSVTRGQERELKDKWIPQICAYFERIRRDKP